MNLFFLTIYFLINLSFNEIISDVDYSSPDLKIYDACHSVYIEVYRSNGNTNIFKNNGNTSDLTWYSIGRPSLLAAETDQVHFSVSEDKLYFDIQMLKSVHKGLFAKELQKKYKVDIRADQIKNLILSNFTCNTSLKKDDGQEIILTAAVRSFQNFPLKLNFDNIRDHSAKFLFLTRAWQGQLNLQCAAFIGIFQANYEVSARKSPLCLNSGVCLSNGSCKCLPGYTGVRCEANCNKNVFLNFCFSETKNFPIFLKMCLTNHTY